MRKNIKSFFSLLVALTISASCNASDDAKTAGSNNLTSPPAKQKDKVGKQDAHPDNSATGRARSAIISFASSNVRYDKDQQPISKTQKEMVMSAWKGERVNTQILVWPNSGISNFSVKGSDFKGGQSTFGKSSLKFGYIKYVAANISGGHCGKVPNLPEVSVADAISNQSTIALSKNKIQPVWLTIDVPRNVAAGEYTCKITFSGDGSNDFDTMSLKIKVDGHILPQPASWNFYLDLSQFPLSEARYYKVKPWSDEHFAKIKPNMMRLANAGQKVITTSFFWDPFSMETSQWGEENLMIRIQKGTNGQLTYDFTNFDKWVNFMMSLGINKQISVYGLYPFNNNFEFYFKDAKKDYSSNAKALTANKAPQQMYSKQSFALLSNDYNDFWSGLLTAFAQHLKQKGWFNKTVLFFDERPAKETAGVIQFVKKTIPDFKIGYAGGYHPEFMKDVSYFSIASYLIIPPDVLSQMQQQGRIVSYYTCCTEKKPNIFTYSDPAEGVFLGWYALANNYNGYMRYAYDQWSPSSATDTRHPLVPAGDNMIVYPNNNSSVRFEKLLEGIQDFEKIRILKAEWTKKNQQSKLAKLDAILSRFKRTSVGTITDYEQIVEDAQQFINN